VVLKYHDGMSVPRQGGSPKLGRVNQKRRTREALVKAGEELLRQGIAPTVAQAAEAALVSRTTAYRYFPTQESLLLELTVTIDVGDVEALVQEPVDTDGAVARALEVIDRFNRHVHQQEAQYRTAQRVYQDQWLDAVAKGDSDPLVRQGRRGRWLETSLAPLADQVPKAEYYRLIKALSLVMGGEAMVVMRDVCHLDTEEAAAVTNWVARTLIDATFGEVPHG
jgi:AcrR family transcriptional regulator